MNRREALQAGLGILSAVSVDGEVATLSTANPKAFVITTPKVLSDTRFLQLREQWKHAFAGTPYADVPVVIMQDGMELQVIDQPAQ